MAITYETLTEERDALVNDIDTLCVAWGQIADKLHFNERTIGMAKDFVNVCSRYATVQVELAGIRDTV